MNQILDYSPDKSASKSSSKSDNVVRVFAILLAVFAIVLLAIGGYSLNKNKTHNEPGVAVEKSKPDIQVLKKGNALEINIIHDKELSQVFYCWDKGKETALNISGSEVHEQISLLAGEHDLIVKAVDIDGEESTFGDRYVSDVGADKENPVIEHENDETRNKIIITATDETEISYITYRWDDEEEVKVEAESEGQKQIVAEIDVDISKNDKYLNVIAVDKSNNSSSWGEPYSVRIPPTIRAVVSENKDNIDFYVSDEKGIKEIVGTLNGTEFSVDIGEGNPKESNFSLPLDTSVQKNEVKIRVVSITGITTDKEFPVENEIAAIDNDNIVVTLGNLEGNPDIAYIKIESPDGIKKLNLNINDMDMDCNIGDRPPEEITDIYFELGIGEYGLIQGNNKITFKITKPNDTEKEETKEIYLGQ